MNSSRSSSLKLKLVDVVDVDLSDKRAGLENSYKLRAAGELVQEMSGAGAERSGNVTDTAEAERANRSDSIAKFAL